MTVRLPTPTKTWQFTTNQLVDWAVSNEATTRTIFIGVKNAMCAFPLNPWAVLGSCDSTAFALPGADLFVDYTDIVYGAGNHSWIVLQQPATGLQVCIDFVNALVYRPSIILSVASGFAGGALNARPTAADEVVVASSTSVLPVVPAIFENRTDVLHSTDGKNTMIVYDLGTMWVFGEAGSPVSGWTTPLLGCVTADSNSDWKNAFIKSVGPAGSMPLWQACEGGGGYGLTWDDLEYPDTLDSSNIMLPILLCSTTAGMQGVHGMLIDMWIPGAATLGSFIPATTKLFRLIGNGYYVIPWNGTYP